MANDPFKALAHPIRRGVVGRLRQGQATTVGCERTFRARAHGVFDAWTSVEVLGRWWHAEHAWETPHAELDLRVGGALRITMRDPQRGQAHGGGGQFTEIDPPRRLA